MTKEELEKEAKTECFMLTVNTIGIDQRDVELAYVMGAEPREKQIEIDAKQIRALQKQNGELTDELTLTNNECKDMREELKQRIRENQKLCEQIEKMRQCGNCGNGTIGNCEYCKRKPNQTRTDTSDYWRLKEIKRK